VSPRGLALPCELLAAQALAPGDLGKVPAETAAGGGSIGNWIAVGDGAVLYRDELETLEMRVPEEESPLHLISGESICEIAVGLPASETIDMVLPDYRRRPDAEIALERAGGAGGARA